MALDKVKYWLDIADYDMETAKAMFETKRWLYVGFMCHQVLEKTLKAYWCATQPEDPPYTHSLLKLAAGCQISEALNESQRKFIEMMMPMNIEARYPDYKQALASGLTSEGCAEIITETKNMQQWIKSKL